MTAITYTATREIISGHVASTNYNLETGANALDDMFDRESDGDESIGGAKETILYRIKKGWRVTTGYIDEADLPAWKEFLASVSASESFSFDAYGTIAAPDNVQTVTLTGRFRISRVDTLQTYQISFDVEEI